MLEAVIISESTLFFSLFRSSWLILSPSFSDVSAVHSRMSVRPLECLDAGSNLHAILLRANYLVVYRQDDLAWYVGVRQIARGKV